MNSLHESIVGMMLGKPIGTTINENHNTVVKQLNSAAGSQIGGEKPAFKHGSGARTDSTRAPGTKRPKTPGWESTIEDQAEKPTHDSPVKDHYYHQGNFAGQGNEQHEHHITVSHHADNTATVQHSAYRQKWSDRARDYSVSEKHKEKHFKDLPSAMAHVKTLHTPA